MKFIIERVSSWMNNNKPCKNAVLKERIKIDFAGNYVNIWEVEVNKVEELMSIIEETGESIILRRESYYKDMPLIQIYDDYIE